jgi:hypothetical protein
MITEIVYLGHNNTIDLLLKADGVAVDLSSVTRMVIELNNGTEIDSVDNPAAFDWTTGITGKLSLSLGDEVIAAGRYSAVLVVYDPTNLDGIVWNKFWMVIK